MISTFTIEYCIENLPSTDKLYHAQISYSKTTGAITSINMFADRSYLLKADGGKDPISDTVFVYLSNIMATTIFPEINIEDLDTKYKLLESSDVDEVGNEANFTCFFSTNDKFESINFALNK